MHNEYIELGPVPYDEECVNVGQTDYMEKARVESKRYKDLLSKCFPDMHFSVKSFPHDFGSYLEVVVYYDEDVEEQADMAFYIEANAPPTWDALEKANPITFADLPNL